MIKTIINEKNENINHSQEILSRLNLAFVNQQREIQLIISPLLSHLVYVDNLLKQIRQKINPNHLGSDGKPTAELKVYFDLLKEYNSITQDLIKVLNEKH